MPLDDAVEVACRQRLGSCFHLKSTKVDIEANAYAMKIVICFAKFNRRMRCE